MITVVNSLDASDSFLCQHQRFSTVKVDLDLGKFRGVLKILLNTNVGCQGGRFVGLGSHGLAFAFVFGSIGSADFAT